MYGIENVNLQKSGGQSSLGFAAIESYTIAGALRPAASLHYLNG